MTVSSEQPTPGRPAMTGPLLATVGITLIAAAAVVVWSIVAGLGRVKPLGDGHDPQSYGFELGAIVEDRGFAVSGQPRDFMPSLDHPETLRGDEIVEYNRSHRRRPVVSADRVVGVVVGGEARAYPLPLLEAHEIVNDELGGVPIAISFSPLADLAVVFDRRIEGSTREFGLSGLMLDSAHLLYDRGAETSANELPSLWSPIRLQAVAGPSLGAAIPLLPFVSVARWADWLSEHPETTVAVGNEGSRLRDRRIDYTHELTRPGLTFPVAGLDAAAIAEFDESAWARLKAPSIAVRDPQGTWRLVDLATIDPEDSERVEIEGLAIRIRVGRDGRSAIVLASDPSESPAIVSIPCLRFAAERIAAESRSASRSADR